MLLVIAWRFKKLKKWIIGHIRALEDVKRWPAKKENEKGGDRGLTSHPPWRELNEMRVKLVEMQSRISESGREMTKFTTSSGMLSTMPLRVQTNSSFAIHADELLNNRRLPFSPTKSTIGLSYYGDRHRRESVSPPSIRPSAIRAEQPRSCCRSDYQTGDHHLPQAP